MVIYKCKGSRDGGVRKSFGHLGRLCEMTAQQHNSQLAHVLPNSQT